jgi:hypothetical protein
LRRTGARKTMTPLAKGLGALFGLPIILAIVFFTYFNRTGEDRMRAICSEVKPGMTQAQMDRFVLDKRLDGFAADKAVNVLGDPRSYGHHTCKVTMEAGTVKAAEYRFAD